MNIAQAQKEIEKLRKQREEIYSKQIAHIDGQIEKFNEFIKHNCSHPEELIYATETYEEDEYGTHHPSWDKFKIECTVCRAYQQVYSDKARDNGYSFRDFLLMDEETLKSKGLK